MLRITSSIAFLLVLTVAAGAQELRTADLGECRLESGERILDCRLAYRTLGRLNAGRSNAVLVPTWFTGTTQQLLSNVGPGKMIDSSRFFVILVDAFGNGVSSSPSNSARQPGASFPRFTIRDMVAAQHRLLGEVLGVRQLHAVVGISMGGMQAFEWIVTHPAMAARAVSIVGTPKLAAFDLLLWETQLRLIEQCRRVACEDLAGLVDLIFQLALQTPDYRNRLTPPDSVDEFITRLVDQSRRRFDAENMASQLRAMIAHDVSAPYGGSLRQAADRVRAELLVVVATYDHVVTPGPSREFARLRGAPVLELTSDCGHGVFACDGATVHAAVREFLRRSGG